MGKRGKKVSDKIKENVLKLSATYGVGYLAPHFSLSKSEIYKIIRQHTKRKPHLEELSITALALASNLETYHGNLGTVFDFTKIGDAVYGGLIYEIGSQQSVRMQNVDKAKASNLLRHLKAEVAELSDIDDWSELTSSRITDGLISKLKTKGYRGDFNGRCPECPR
jgi:alanine racemase